MLLSVEALRVEIDRPRGGPVRPVRGVDLAVAAGETVALVGESGCGKSMTCLAVAGLLPRRGRIAGGRVLLDGVDLASVPPAEARRLRRRGLASVFQDATGGLNPVRSVGWQVAEAVRLRSGMGRAEARAEAVRLLGRVGLPDPERRAVEFPHQFSGGMNQRAMIALAIAGGPRVLVCDEATTALDVTLQAQIVALIAELRDGLGMGVLFVTHDLGLVAQIADRVVVMYAGRSVETADVASLFARPRHPYAAGLLAALPRAGTPRGELPAIEGRVPAVDALPAGCAFAPRCPRATALCRREDPPTIDGVACHHPLIEVAA